MTFLKKPTFWLGIIISAVCLITVLRAVDLATVATTIRSAEIIPLTIAIALILIYMLLRAIRWRFMLNNIPTIHRTFHIQNIGYMLTQILPLRIGDPARAILIGNEKGLTVGQGLTTMVVERVLDLFAVIIILPFTLTLVPNIPDWISNGLRISGILAIIAVTGILVAANFQNRFMSLIHTILDRIPFLETTVWDTRIQSLFDGLSTLTNWRGTLGLLGLTISVWIPIIAAYQYMMQAVGLDPSYFMAAFVTCIAALSIAAPSSPGQVGVFHASATAAVTLLGMNPVQGASFAFLYHAINFLILIGLGLIGLWRTQSSLSSILSTTRSFQSKVTDHS